MQHTDRLRLPGSFIVVSASPPTDFDALAKLDSEVPDRVFIHLGGVSPREIGGKPFGLPLMHSKVFYARSESNCWLMTGSNNLTAYGTQGINCEAAITLDGNVIEKPFMDALEHLIACRQQAVPFDLNLRPKDPEDEDKTERFETLIIHAESEPLEDAPGFVHLCLPDEKHDDLLRPGSRAILYLYPLGTLRGAPDPQKAFAVFHGRQTAVNFTEDHSKTSGIPAEWQDASYLIEPNRSVFYLSLAKPASKLMTTQVVLNLTDRDNQFKEDMFLSAKPIMKSVPSTDMLLLEGIDPDMREYILPRPDRMGNVQLELKKAMSQHVILTAKDEQKYPEHLAMSNIHDAYGAELKIKPKAATTPSERSLFDVDEAIEEEEIHISHIYRASYRILRKHK
jgi:hypothetical protein